MSALPPPRRLITGHTASGAPDIKDDVLVPSLLPAGFAVTEAFTQEQFLITPQQAAEGADIKVERMPLAGGILVRYLDLPPGFDGTMHFCNRLDYLVILSGQIELSFHDGSQKSVGPGDLVVQLGNAHQWTNKTDQWARALAIILPLKEPVKIDGKGLGQALGIVERH
ncbi:hypothetical protein P7C73_g3338, partial [Tremellales sp. Uapishka_1]